MPQETNIQCGREGRLPAMAPLANPYVPFQLEDPPKYEPQKALIRGTLYPGLDLPFKGMVNNDDKSCTPLGQLQTLDFILQELALYLDTHRDDKEALALYRNFQQVYRNSLAEYEKMYGPITRTVGCDHDFRWLDDPWPWEYAQNQEV